MSFPAPFEQYRGEVLPEWIDHNGHMNLAYYVVLFDQATDLLFDALGIGSAYRSATGNGTFAVEAHTLWERELLVAERVRVASWIIGADDKRLHVAHEMRRLDRAERVAAQELMFVHVDLKARRVSPYPPDLKARVEAAEEAHRAVPRPDWIGRRLGLPHSR